MELPKFNQKIEVEVLQGPYAASYSTHVVGVDNRSISVVHPMVGGHLLVLNPGEAVRVEFAVRGSRLSYVARVLEVDTRVLPVVVFSLPAPGRVERYQQRDFFRLEASLPLTYAVRYLPDGSVRSGAKFRTTTRDISGNGAQILCAELYPKGALLDIELELENGVVSITGEVVRLVEQLSRREFWQGIRFIGLEQQSRDLIIRYIFKEQRRRRQLGLL